MTHAWKTAAVLLAGALVLVAAGLWMLRAAHRDAHPPPELIATRKALHKLGGAPGLAVRQKALQGLLGRLEIERAARGADAAAFSGRLEAVLGELGLTVTSSSEWKAVPEFKVEGAAAFERVFAGSGDFAHLLEAIHTIESWPDQARVRALTVTGEAAGTVAWQLAISVVRLAPGEEG